METVKFSFDIDVANALDEPFFVKDERHRWVFLNDAAVNVIGLPRNELIGLTDYDIFDKRQADVFVTRDELVLQGGNSDINEEEITWKGKLHYISTKKSLYVDSSCSQRFIVGTIRDITRRRALERLVFSKHVDIEAMYDALDIGVVVFKIMAYGSDIVLEYMNPAAQRTDAVQISELVGEPLESLHFSSPYSDIIRLVRDVWSTGQTASLRVGQDEYIFFCGYRSRVFVFIGISNSGMIAEAFPSLGDRLAHEKPIRNRPAYRQAKAQFDKLCAAMIKEKVYHSDSLSLYELADHIKMRRNEVSALINSFTCGNFYDFVNAYRIEEVKQALVQPADDGRTILDIAFDAGFANKSTFNKCFWKATGMTPSDYRRAHRKGV